MKLRTKICPNECTDPNSKSKQKRIRMIIISIDEDTKKHLDRSVTLIDWLCQECGETFPVSYYDVLKISKKPLHSLNITLREPYGLKSKSEQK